MARKEERKKGKIRWNTFDLYKKLETVDKILY